MAIKIKEEMLLIKNTTKEEREKIVKSNFGLASINSKLDCEDSKFLDMYIEGKIELSEARELALNNYKKGGS